MYPSEPFPHFVDDYLAYLYEVLPGQASRDGVHVHDDLLEDLSRPAIDAHIRALAGFRRRLYQIDPEHLPPAERVDHTIVGASIDGRMHDLEQVRLWERSPRQYAEVIASGLAGQALFDHAPEVERARRVVSKLRQVPRLVQAARDNVKECPGIFVKGALDAWRGALKFVEADLPRAFSRLDDLHILGDLADTSTDAVTAMASYLAYLETDLAPRAKASFRIGREKFEQKLKLEQGVSLGADRLLTLALRELTTAQEEFRTVAGQLGSGDPVAAWRAARAESPVAAELFPTVQAQLKEIEAFVRRQTVVSVPDGEPVVVASAPSYGRWRLAQARVAGPFETRPGRALYHLSDPERGWPAERQQEQLAELNVPTLWNLAMHEVLPGRVLLHQQLRRVESKVRKSLLLAPSSFVAGWAHYAGQMMVEAGFRKSDHALRAAQLVDVQVHLCRLIVGIRLHCEDLSVEQGMRFFRDEASLDEPAARREAERGTYDADYGVSALGRLMMVKMRRDYTEQQEGKVTPRVFHDAVLTQGAAPFWAHRRLLFADQSDAVLE